MTISNIRMNVPALLATYQLRQREHLLRITRAMTSRLELPSLLRLILSSATEMVDGRSGLIVLERANGVIADTTIAEPRFEIRATVNLDHQFLSAFEPLLEVGPIVHIDDDPAMQEESSTDPLHYLGLQERARLVEQNLGNKLGQVLGLPLLFEDELLGIIYLFRDEYAFTRMDLQMLQGFANQAAVAVRNARVYQQLENERSQLATILENSANGVMILDAKRRVLVINQSLAAMVGIAQDEAVGQHFSNVLALENAQGDDLTTVDDVHAFFYAAESMRSEGDLSRPGGARLTLSVTYTPIFNEADILVNIVVTVYDITRFREEEEIKSTFTSIISHELKTPVALIKGYAQTLAREDASWDAETARQSLEIIEEEADRLEALINNLLDVSRIQASGLRLDRDDVNLALLAEKVAAGFRLQTEEHTIELDFPDALPLVSGDEERLRQVLTNLVGNAIKYSPEGGIIRIGGWQEAATDTAGRRVVLYVADQGIGIPDEEAALIFGRFYRIDSSLRRSTAGAGLGLYLTKAIIDAHDGDIWVRSEAGKGTTFFVALPVDEAPDTFSDGHAIGATKA